jgi:hypothetical protein
LGCYSVPATALLNELSGYAGRRQSPPIAGAHPRVRRIDSDLSLGALVELEAAAYNAPRCPLKKRQGRDRGDCGSRTHSVLTDAIRCLYRNLKFLDRSSKDAQHRRPNPRGICSARPQRRTGIRVIPECQPEGCATRNRQNGFLAPTLQLLKYLLKKSRVRCQASLAAASSYRGVVSLWKP